MCGGESGGIPSLGYASDWEKYKMFACRLLSLDFELSTHVFRYTSCVVL